MGPAVLGELLNASCSRARSHYRLTRGLLPAACPPWAGTSLLRQPGVPSLHRADHIDAKFSADAQSTQTDEQQDSHPQAVHHIWPPGSWITGARRDSQPTECVSGGLVSSKQLKLGQTDDWLPVSHHIPGADW